MRHGFAVLAVAALVTSLGASGASAGTVPTGFSDTVVFSGLNQPTSVAFAPDGKVFVAEKSGIIKVYASLTATTPTVFADLRTEVHNWWDRGLNGLTVDPNFPTNPYVYVTYTYDAKIGGTAPTWGTAGATDDSCPTPPGDLTSDNGDGCLASGRLSRLTFNPSTSQMVPGSEDVLINDWCVQYNTHSMGHVAFGPDGMLYASGGDGASADNLDWGQWGGTQPNSTNPLVPKNPCGDPPAGAGGSEVTPTTEGGALRSQSPRRPSTEPRTLDGTIIRVDPATGQGLSTNPFGSSSDADAKRIIAYGLRNPFRWTFRPGTSELWIANVGASTYESIDRDLSPTAAPNFGWPCYEGPGPMTNGPNGTTGYQQAGINMCTSLYNDNSWTPPYFTYKHGNSVSANDTCSPNVSGTAITGIDFYTGNSYPSAYHNALFFGDYARNCIWVMYPGSNGLPDPTNVATFDQGASSPVDIESGPNGDLFYADINGGTIHRISFGSNQTGAPQNTSAPTITGAAQAGQTLTEDDGAWSGTTPISFTRQWLRCDGSGAGCAPIAGATGTSYVLTSADVGSTLRVAVTATNSVGTASAQSALTAVVVSSGSPVALGNTTVGSVSDTGWDGLKWGNKYALSVQGTFTKVSAYLGDNPSVTGSEQFRAAIYADASGVPGALKAQSSTVTIVDGQAAGWVDFAISPSVTLPAGTYWIVLQGGPTLYGALRYGTSNSTTGAEAWNHDAFADGLTDPFGTANSGNWVWSLYATYS